MRKKIINNWLDEFEEGGVIEDPEKPKYTAKTVPKNINPNNLRPSMFTDENEYLTYFGINNRYNCGVKGCAKFANDYVGKAIGLEGQSYSDWTRQGQKAGVGGHAWQNYGLITGAGGKSIYNKYTNQGNFSDLKPGDVIGLEHRNRTVYSGNYDIKGDNKPLAGVKNSHTGVVDYVKTNPDGSKTVYIKHNIGGTVHFEELKLNKNTGYYQAGPNWKLVTAARPNFGKFSPEFKYDEEKQEWTIDPYVSDYNPNNMVGLTTDQYDVYSDINPLEKIGFEKNPIVRNEKLKAEKTRLKRKPGTVNVYLFNKDMVEALNSLNKNKKALMDYYKMSEDDFNSLAKQVIATAGVESQFGTSPKEKFKTDNPGVVTLAKGNINDWLRSLGTKGRKRLDRFGENSLGIFQVKPYSVDPYFLDHFDLGNMKNFSKPEGNVLASFSHLYDDQKKAEKWLPKNSNLSQESLQDPTNVSYAVYNTPLTVKSGNLTPHPQDENKYANIRLRRYVEYKDAIPKISNIETDTFIDPKYSNLPEYTVTPKYRQGGRLDTLQYQYGGTLTSPEQYTKDQITGDAVPIKSAIAYGSAFGNPSVKRMVAPVDNPYIFKGDEPYTTPDMKGEYGTHYMFSEGNYAVPTIQQGLNGLFYNEQAGPMDREAIRFDRPIRDLLDKPEEIEKFKNASELEKRKISDSYNNLREEADRFATRYKEFSPAFKYEYKKGGWLDNL